LARAFASQRGPAAECLNRLLTPPHVLLSSTPMLLELERVLAYPRLRSLHGMTNAEIMEAVKHLALVVELVDVSNAPTVSIVREDADDDAIVATAVAGAANVLCTRDAHLHEPAVVAF
jgi:putative PIN family toxin of toxin-antitoxin system